MINKSAQSDAQRTEDLKKYILSKLEKGGITENDIASHVFFNDKLNRMGTFVYCKEEKYCLKYLGFRESECYTSFFSSKEELTAQLLKDIIVSKALEEYPHRYKEYALQIALKTDSGAAALLEKEVSQSAYFKE